MRSASIALLVVGVMASCALGQVPVVTSPQPVSTSGGNGSTTIGSTGTFQKVWGANVARRGCTIVNKGANTMYVTEGLGVAASTQTLAAQVAVGGAFYCANPGGTVLTGEIDITGTTSDAFYAAQY